MIAAFLIIGIGVLILLGSRRGSQAEYGGAVMVMTGIGLMLATVAFYS